MCVITPTDGAHPDGITILRSARGLVIGAKTHSWDDLKEGFLTQPWGRESFFTHQLALFNSVDDIFLVLRSLSIDPHAFVVRGLPDEKVWRNNKGRARRLLYPKLTKSGTQHPATIIDVPRSWMMLDIDKIPVPPGVDIIDNADAAVEFVISTLVEYAPELEGVSMVWQASSSAGIVKGALSLHLWVLLAKSYTNEELRRWCQGVNSRAEGKLLDYALMNAVQPHYTANPLFRGRYDPVPQRLGIWRGIDARATLDIPAMAPRRSVSAQDAGNQFGGSLDDRLAAIGGSGGFHGPIKSAVGSFARRSGAKAEALWPSFRARLQEAITSAPPGDRAPGDIARYADELFLDQLFNWVLGREALKPIAELAYPGVRRLSVPAARRALQAAVDVAFGRASTWKPDAGALPPQMMVKVDTGLGKTEAVIRAAGHFISASAAAGLSRTVVIMAPTHKLVDEIAERVSDVTGIAPAIWRGRNAADPEAVGEGGRKSLMCLERDLAAAGEDALQEMMHICQICPSRGQCGYNRQRAQKSPIWIMTNATLFAGRPEPVPEPDLIILDEAFYQAAVHGIGDDELIAPDQFFKKTDHLRVAALQLSGLRSLLMAAIRGNGCGILTAAAIEKVGLTKDECLLAESLEWEKKPKVNLEEGATASTLIGRLHEKADPDLPLRARIWSIAAAQREGCFDQGTLYIEPGGVFRPLWRQAIHEEWASAPVLALDATTDPEMVRALLPNLEVLAEVRAETPHAHVTQLVGTEMSHARLAVKQGTQVKRGNRSNADLLADRIKIEARALEGRAGDAGRLLVVAQKAVEDTLRTKCPAPNVSFRHFNDVAGEDLYRDYGAVIVVGRTAPPPAACERLAEALFGRAVEHLSDGPWPLEQMALLLADGSTVNTSVPRHPDRLVEAVRRTIMEGGVLQALGRVRAVNRTKDDPVAIILLTSLPFPISVHAAVSIDEVEPCRSAVALHRAGVLPTSANARARMFPDLWETAKAAEMDPVPGRDTLRSLLDIHIGGGGYPAAASYTLRGVGGRPVQVLHYLPADEAKRSLEGAFGPLASFESQDPELRGNGETAPGGLTIATRTGATPDEGKCPAPARGSFR